MFYDLIEDVRLLWPGSHLYAGPVVARIVVSGGQGEGVPRGRKKGTQGEEQQLFRHSSRPIKMIYSRESFLAFQGTSHREPTLSLTSHSHGASGAQMAFDFPPPNIKKKTLVSRKLKWPCEEKGTGISGLDGIERRGKLVSIDEERSERRIIRRNPAHRLTFNPLIRDPY